MNNAEIKDPIFLQAVEAIDAGNRSVLQNLLDQYPDLVSRRLDLPEGGYFKNPYLLWFVADNPIRHEKLPANIPEITELLIKAIRTSAPQTLDEQLNYALGLVVTGRIPKECGVQIALMDILIDAGAKPGGGNGAIAHGNLGAASHLIDRGGKLSLAVAVCLDRQNDIDRLIKNATPAELKVALVAASFFGKPDMIKWLIEQGADPNGSPENSQGFHSHATALHQAVYSGSLESVKILIAAGADLDAQDRIYGGTPLGWAMYMPSEIKDETEIKKYREIETYLKTFENKKYYSFFIAISDCRKKNANLGIILLKFYDHEIKA